MMKIHTTIGLRVSFFSVCEIAVHNVSTSPGDCAFVDHHVHGLDDDRIPTSVATTRRIDFREHVIQRDGSACVITLERKEHCDAAHLIPHRKGDEVRFVVSSYSHLMTLFSSIFEK
jgi:hypothetical protein